VTDADPAWLRHRRRQPGVSVSRDQARAFRLALEPFLPELDQHLEEAAADVECVLAPRDAPQVREDGEGRRAGDRVDECAGLLGGQRNRGPPVVKARLT
jgi:hypothetical protein